MYIVIYIFECEGCKMINKEMSEREIVKCNIINCLEELSERELMRVSKFMSKFVE